MLPGISIAVALLVGGTSASSFPDCLRGPLATNQVCNVTAAPSERAAALVAAMTLAEKQGNLIDRSLGAPRLGLPPYAWWNEALHGVAGSPGVSFARGNASFAYATSFANPILLSAAFDDELVEKVATVVSTEARAFSNAGRAGLDFWTPNINPFKDPRWGRGAETPGEDPFRIKGYVKAVIRGLEGRLEGSGTTRKLIATCKHFAGYDMERWNGVLRYGFDAIISLQDLSEYYLPPFQQCARDSQVGSIMCSYNAINGTPACANSYIMTDILREHWGWKADNNFITSDCNAVQHFYKNFNYSSDAAHAAAAALIAGTDTICEVPGQNNGSDISGSSSQGLLPENAIDRALRRLYEGLVRVGYFDPEGASPYRSLSWSDVNTLEAQELAIQSAADALVLTKNDGTLPLDLAGKKFALIGHWANATTQMLGGYSGVPPFFHNPVAAAQQLGLSFTYATGPVNQSTSSTDTWTDRALAAAATADVILYFGGTDLSVEAEDRDRYSIALPGAQLALVGALSALGKPLVVVQLGSLTDDTPLLQNRNVSAIIWAGFPGQSGGTAVFNIISGKQAPAGRLPVTEYPAHYVNDVSLLDMTLRPSATNPGRTYMWYNSSVLPFGHGIHYTTFESSLREASTSRTYAIQTLKATCGPETKHPDLCSFVDIQARVTNKGAKTSDFVALAFLAGEYGPTPYPVKQLAGYRRLRGVRPGQTVEVSIAMTLGTLARTDESGNTVLYPGRYKILLDVPTSSETTFTLTGEPWVLDFFPQPKA